MFAPKFPALFQKFPAPYCLMTQNATPESLRFLTPSLCRELAETYGTPIYVYDEATLREHATKSLAFPNAYGLTVRYAMKANPTRAILRIFREMGLNIDASSGYEVQRAIAAGFKPHQISLSSQEMAENVDDLIDLGVRVFATSLEQLKRIGESRPGATVGIRFNPGLGSGGTSRTNVGGPGSAFGLWHEQADDAHAILQAHQLTCNAIHTHIGSGSDPEVWQRVAHMSLDLVRKFPDVTTLDLGGGYKVGRMADEVSTDLQEIGAPVKEAFESFAAETGRQLHLEIEPGTFLVANAGAILSTIQDIVTTGDEGYTFYRSNTGMTDVLRPSLYGAQHPLVVVPSTDREDGPVTDILVVGHCCESGDLLTPGSGDPEALAPRPLHHAEVGDLLVVEVSGAYCAAMTAKNYNSFPTSAEVLVREDGTHTLVRQRQAIQDLWKDEIELA